MEILLTVVVGLLVDDTLAALAAEVFVSLTTPTGFCVVLVFLLPGGLVVMGTGFDITGRVVVVVAVGCSPDPVDVFFIGLVVVTAAGAGDDFFFTYEAMGALVVVGLFVLTSRSESSMSLSVRMSSSMSSAVVVEPAPEKSLSA